MEFFKVFFSAVLCAYSMASGAHAAEIEAYTFKGQVLDDASKPVDGAIVKVGTLPTCIERLDQDLTRTMSDGRFLLDTPYPPPFAVSVYHPDFVPVTTQITKADGDIGIEVSLTPGESLDGRVRVTDLATAPIWVTVYCPNADFEAMTQCDERGLFRFTGLPPGKCFVSVRAEDPQQTVRYGGEKESFLLPGADNRVDFRFEAGPRSIAGVVHDDTGNPVKADVTYFVIDDTQDFRFTTTSGADGHFKFESVPAGAGQLFATTRGRSSHLIEVPPGDALQVVSPINVEEGADVKCTFVNVPDGVSQIEMVLFYGKPATPTGSLADIQYLLDQPIAQSKIAGDRVVTLNDVPPGTFTLLAYPLTPDFLNDAPFHKADALLKSTVYMDSFTVNEVEERRTIAVAFPRETPYQIANKPIHPIVGRWVYEYKGSQFMRTFTRDGRCILSEGPLVHWEVPYVILGRQRVAIIHKNSRNIHTVREDDRLDIHGRFVGTRVKN